VNGLDLLYIPAAVTTAPLWALKRRGGWRERFGRTPTLPPVAAGKRGRILLHAVSVGEVNALRALVPLLTPEAEVVISTTTDTGLCRARALFEESCRVVRYPLDFSWSVRRFLDAVRPDAVALVELEVWPNFVRACERRGIAACIVNGRLSERSARGYARIRRFMGGWLRTLRFVAVQDEAYAARFEALGVEPGACLLTGSMKWDAPVARPTPSGGSDAAARLAAELGIDRNRPLVVAGSTGPGEEALLDGACPAGVQLLCAPRRLERFDEAAAALPGCARRSAGGSGSATGRFLLDTIGELGAAYALADVVVVGRSFGDLHGSDPIEPIALGKPTVIGPAVGDFAAIVRTFGEAGGLIRTDADALSGVLAGLLGDPARRGELVRNGSACIARNRGASQRHADLLLSLLDEPRGEAPSRMGPDDATLVPVGG